MHLEPPHPGSEISRQDRHLIPDREAAAPQRAGDHRPEPLDAEHAIHREPENPLRALGFGRRRLRLDRRKEGRQSLPRRPGAGHDRTPVQKRSLQELGHVGLHHLQPFGLDQVRLGERHQPLLDLEQLADVQVLARLGHHPLVGGDHQHHQVNAPDARDHGLDEPLVARHVHDPGPRAVRQAEERESQLDGDSALLLLLQAVRVRPGEGLHQGGLAVVDMAGGADDQMAHAESSPGGPLYRGDGGETSRTAVGGSSISKFEFRNSRFTSRPGRSAATETGRGCR